MSDNNAPAGHIPSNQAHAALAAAETIATQAVTHSQGPDSSSTVVNEAVSKAAAALVGNASLQMSRAELLIVLHVSNTSFQLNALAGTKKAVVTRQGGREVTVNLYSPFHRHNSAKAKSLPSGLIRGALPVIFETMSRFNGLSIALPDGNGDAQARLAEAAKILASSVRRTLVVGANEVVTQIQTDPEDENSLVPVKMSDLVRVDHWVAPAEEEDENPAPTIQIALHVHAGALYDSQDPATWIRQQSSILETFAKDYPNASFKIAFAIGSEALVQGTAIDLLNYLSVDENTVPYGRAALKASSWLPQDADKILWNSDFFFLKNQGEALSDPAAPAGEEG